MLGSFEVFCEQTVAPYSEPCTREAVSSVVECWQCKEGDSLIVKHMQFPCIFLFKVIKFPLFNVQECLAK
jgi:hypothetical protein